MKARNYMRISWGCIHFLVLSLISDSPWKKLNKYTYYSVEDLNADGIIFLALPEIISRLMLGQLFGMGMEGSRGASKLNKWISGLKTLKNNNTNHTTNTIRDSSYLLPAMNPTPIELQASTTLGLSKQESKIQKTMNIIIPHHTKWLWYGVYIYKPRTIWTEYIKFSLWRCIDISTVNSWDEIHHMDVMPTSRKILVFERNINSHNKHKILIW